MNLLVIRHGEAEEGGGVPDAKRELTQHGRELLSRSSVAIRRIVPKIDLVIASPLVRAIQTAEIVCSAYGNVELRQNGALRSETSPEETLLELAREAEEGTECLCCVGHEPNLSLLVSFSITGDMIPVVQMRKGAACLVKFRGRLSPGGATLLWLAHPEVWAAAD